MILGKLQHGTEHWNYGLMAQRSILNQNRVEISIFLFKNGANSRVTSDITKGGSLTLTIAI